MNKTLVEKILLPIPPVKEIVKVVEMVEFSLLQVQKQEAAITLALKQSAAQRQNILKAAFSGQLVPQDPNDEPASVLLERIRAERVARDLPENRNGRQSKKRQKPLRGDQSC